MMKGNGQIRFRSGKRFISEGDDYDYNTRFFADDHIVLAQDHDKLEYMAQKLIKE